MIKAIDTKYNGYKFRSRLEARWAVFFDELGIKYEYEPEGFELSNGEKYLPDFYLPSVNSYAEIKHSGAIKREFDNSNQAYFTSETENIKKIFGFVEDITKQNKSYILLCGDPWEVIKNKNEGFGEVYSRMACIGKILNNNNESYNCDCNKCNVESKIVSFDFRGFDDEGMLFDFLPSPSFNFPFIADNEKIKYYESPEKFVVENRKYIYCHTQAASIARQARFEHGEKP